LPPFAFNQAELEQFIFENQCLVFTETDHIPTSCSYILHWFIILSFTELCCPL